MESVSTSPTEDYSYLDNATYETCSPFIPQITHGKVVKVYDGDTITIATKIGADICRFSVRLNGIDTPEIKAKNENEKIRAKRARDALNAMIFGKIVKIEVHSYDKYGRILADVVSLDDGTNMSEYMLKNGHATKYDGGTKINPEYWVNAIDDI